MPALRLNTIPFMHIALTILSIVLIAYGAVVVLMALMQNRLVFFPNPQDAFVQVFTPFDIVTTQTSDGLTLKGFYAPPQGHKPVLVYFHGNAGNAANRVYKTDKILAAGYGMLLTEYRGYGGNPGRPTEQGLYDDARSWLRYLQTEHHISIDRLVYYGESLGTGVAVQMATEFPAKAVILEAPFTSVTDVGAYYYPYLPVRWVARYRFESLRKASALTMPVLIYHGEQDRTVPYKFGQTLFAAIPSADKIFKTFPAAGHANLYDFGAADAVVEFLNRYAP
jgi:uncharacterized protein